MTNLEKLIGVICQKIEAGEIVYAGGGNANELERLTSTISTWFVLFGGSNVQLRFHNNEETETESEASIEIESSSGEFFRVYRHTNKELLQKLTTAFLDRVSALEKEENDYLEKRKAERLAKIETLAGDLLEHHEQAEEVE